MPIVDPHWPRADVWLAGDSTQPDLVVVGVPTSKASLVQSRADLAPLAVRGRLHRFSTYDSESGVDLGAVEVRDAGNWPVSELDMYEMPLAVRQLAASLPESTLTIYIGGDNAITRPLVGAMAGDLSRTGVITFDAHHDVRSLANGPTNGTPIRGLIEEDGLPGANVVQIGIGSFANSAAYSAYCDKTGVTFSTASDVEDKGMKTIVGDALASLDHCETIYVDVDVDVLDRVFAPGCPGSAPGGLSIRQLAEGVRLCAREERVIAMDIVEVDPELDVHSVTVDAMAHLFLTAAIGLAQRSDSGG